MVNETGERDTLLANIFILPLVRSGTLVTSKFLFFIPLSQVGHGYYETTLTSSSRPIVDPDCIIPG